MWSIRLAGTHWRQLQRRFDQLTGIASLQEADSNEVTVHAHHGAGVRLRKELCQLMSFGGGQPGASREQPTRVGGLQWFARCMHYTRHSERPADARGESVCLRSASLSSRAPRLLGRAHFRAPERAGEKQQTCRPHTHSP